MLVSNKVVYTGLTVAFVILLITVVSVVGLGSGSQLAPIEGLNTSKLT